MKSKMKQLFREELLHICTEIESILERTKTIERWTLEDSLLCFELQKFDGELRRSVEQIGLFEQERDYIDKGILYQLPLLSIEEYAHIRTTMASQSFYEGKTELLKKIEEEKTLVFCKDRKRTGGQV